MFIFFLYRFVVKGHFFVEMGESLESNEYLVENYFHLELNQFLKLVKEERYRFENFRLSSIRAWRVSAPKEKTHLPEQLAAAGFYYTGIDDKMKCFDCHVEIADWCNREDPLIEHQRLSPRCRMVRDIPCGNISLQHDFLAHPRIPKDSEIRQLDVSKFSLDQLDKTVEVYFENSDRFLHVKLGDLIGAAHPDFIIYEDRLRTFLKHPERWSQSGEDLAAAGWIFANTGDRTYCFHCNGTVERWKPGEDPIKEHVEYFPNCLFIKRLLARRGSRNC